MVKVVWLIGISYYSIMFLFSKAASVARVNNGITHTIGSMLSWHLSTIL